MGKSSRTEETGGGLVSLGCVTIARVFGHGNSCVM